MRKALWLFLFLAFVLPRISAAQEDSLFSTYVVRRGETLAGLFGKKWEFVSRINKVDPRALRVGMKLKVPRDWGLALTYTPLPESLPRISAWEQFVLVDLESQYAAGYEHGIQKFWFPVSSGFNPIQTPHWYIRKVVWGDSVWSGRRYRDSLPDMSTPTGIFKILMKDSVHVSNAFFTEDGLGVPMPWAIAFKWGYWFHGTGGNPRGLPGFPASHGCIRLFDKDAEAFYRWVKRKTAVLIVRNRSEIEIYLEKLNPR